MGKKSKDQDNLIDVVIETPKGSRNKYVWNPETKMFRLKKVLPLGASFPFDFGFVPDTIGEDGDPLDVLVIMDEPAYPGIVTECRLIGALKAHQTEKNHKTNRNDRLVAIAESCSMYDNIQDLDSLPESVRSEIEHFFKSYNDQIGKKFAPLEWCSVKAALKLIKKGRT
jgi:inorganic pyrophosphatase